MKKDTILKEFIKIFWIFMIGSFIGHLFEIIVVIVQKGHFECRQGVLYGPLIPVYGAGAVIYYLFYRKIEKGSKIKIFFMSMLLGGITEYLFSYLQEKIFGTISWDYSNLLFNINGRTSLLHCTYWGIAGILYITYIDPVINKIELISNLQILKRATYILTFFMIINITISCMASIRQRERYNQISADSQIDMFLDRYYPDSYMNSIFTNKMEKERLM